MMSEEPDGEERGTEVGGGMEERGRREGGRRLRWIRSEEPDGEVRGTEVGEGRKEGGRRVRRMGRDEPHR
jgi:hypothetical protein